MVNELDDNDPIDLESLHHNAEGDDRRFIAAVMTRIHAQPGERSHAIGPLWGIWSMARALGVAGLAIALLAVAAHEWNARKGPSPVTLADTLGVPPEFVDGSLIPGGGR